jgi:hypothetical protein
MGSGADKPQVLLMMDSNPSTLNTALSLDHIFGLDVSWRSLTSFAVKRFCFRALPSGKISWLTHGKGHRYVIPAKAGIQRLSEGQRHWIPAFAGMTYRWR